MKEMIMNTLGYPILSTVIFTPVIGAILILLMGRSKESLIKWTALFFSILNFLLSLPLLPASTRRLPRCSLRKNTAGYLHGT